MYGHYWENKGRWLNAQAPSLEQCLLGEIIDLEQWWMSDSSPLQCSLTSQSQIGVQEMNPSLWTYQFCGWGCIRLPLICDLALWFKSCGYSPLIGHTTSAQFHHISILPECLFFSLSALTSFCNPNRLFPQEANFLPRRPVYGETVSRQVHPCLSVHLISKDSCYVSYSTPPVQLYLYLLNP